MKPLDVIGLIGSLVSIGSAIWAAVSVSIIKKTKQDILAKLRIVKYSQLMNSSQEAITQLRKIANKNKVPFGVNFDKIVNSLNDYYENLNAIRNDIKDDGYLDLESHLSDIRNNVNLASKIDRSNPEKLIDIYTNIYYRILDIDNEILKYNKRIIEK